MLASAGSTETALGTIAEYGILGAVCVLLVAALVWAVRGWFKEKDDRLNDQKAMADARQKDNDALKQLTIELKEHSTHLVVEATKSQDAMASSLKRQEDALDDLRGSINNLQQEQVRLTSAVAMSTGGRQG